MTKSHRNRLTGRSRKMQRGQILIIVAFAIVGLIAFVGLVVDTGLVFIGYGRLRRAVDAAALAAAAQYRKDPDPTGLAADAVEFLTLNDVNDPTAVVKVCNDNFPAYHDDSLCTSPAKRRLVRVDATSTVNLTFLPVIGINSVTLQATATSEAASLDIVLVLDVSESMTWEAPANDLMHDPAQCNNRPAGDLSNCQPFHDIQQSAKQFVQDLFPSDGSNVYDRVSVHTFAHGADLVNGAAVYDANLPLTSNRTQILNTITGLSVFSADGSHAYSANPPLGDGSCLNSSGYPSMPAHGPCRNYPPNGDPYCFNPLDGVTPYYDPGNGIDAFSDPLCFTQTFDNPADGYVGPYVNPGDGHHYERAFLGFACDQTDPDWVKYCGTSNIGGALRAAGQEFTQGSGGFRQESLWIVILLTDGVANHSDDNYYCQSGQTTTSHWCQDDPVTTRHCLYDTDTLYAGNPELYPACIANGGVDNPSEFDADDYARAMADFTALGQQALIFTIGYDDAGLLGHDNASGKNWGEALLNYAADMGDNGKVDYPCTYPISINKCNPNYFYYDPTQIGTSLDDIFKAITDRIATRLTH